MENDIECLINEVKSIVKKYQKENIYKEAFINHDECLYYTVMLFGSDDIVDLQFYIEYYKLTKTLKPIICNTRDYTLYETLNLDSVKIAINELKNK